MSQRQIAAARLETLREALSDKLNKISDDLSVRAAIGRQVARIVADIAECRAIVGPPQWYDNPRRNPE
jgi:hypothetical protein